jgi:hypothetical protein
MKKQTKMVIAVSILLIITILITLIIIISYTKNNPVICKDYNIESCPESCVVCPPCEVCSSISCQTKEFCSSIGFKETWYKDMQKRLEDMQKNNS